MTVPSRCDAAEAQVVVGAVEHLVDDVLRARSGRTGRGCARARTRLGEVVHARATPTRADEQRAERVDERDDRPAVEGELRGDREQRRRAASATAERAQRGEKRRLASGATSAEQRRSAAMSSPPGADSSGKPAPHGGDRVAPGSRRPAISSSPRGRGGDGRPGATGPTAPTTHDLVAEEALLDVLPRTTRENETDSDRARRRRGSRSTRRPRRRTSPGSTCSPGRTSTVATAKRLEPVDRVATCAGSRRPESFGNRPLPAAPSISFRSTSSPPRNLPSPVLVHLGGREHDVARCALGDRLAQREVGLDSSLARLGELDVVARSPSAVGGDRGRSPCRAAARGNGQRSSSSSKRDVVDLRRRRGRPAASSSPRIEKRASTVSSSRSLERVGRVGEHAERRQRDARPRGSAPCAGARSATSSRQLAASRASQEQRQDVEALVDGGQIIERLLQRRAPFTRQT